MKTQKGITLIALVITIIVLLILAGVSIAMLTGENGILTQATNAKTETAEAEAIERINLALNAVKSAIYEQQIDDTTYNGGTGNTLDLALVTILSKDGITATAEAEDTYWYTMNAGVLTLHYKNSEANVGEITGTINVATSPYTIVEAPIVAEEP